jgi:hypothetical protein
MRHTRCVTCHVIRRVTHTHFERRLRNEQEGPPHIGQDLAPVLAVLQDILQGGWPGENQGH